MCLFSYTKCWLILLLHELVAFLPVVRLFVHEEDESNKNWLSNAFWFVACKGCLFSALFLCKWIILSSDNKYDFHDLHSPSTHNFRCFDNTHKNLFLMIYDQHKYDYSSANPSSIHSKSILRPTSAWLVWITSNISRNVPLTTFIKLTTYWS